MSGSDTRVYIVILNYRNWQDVTECLGSLFRSDFEDFAAIVIDNDSGNDSLEHLMAWAEKKKVGYRYFHRNDWTSPAARPAALPALTFLQNDVNNGFAGGNNLAIRQLLTEDAYIWLLNPDMVVLDNTLTELVGFARQTPFKTIIGAVVKQYLPPQAIHLYGGGFVNFSSATVGLIKKASDSAAIKYISGGCLFTHTAHFKELGLLPERYFLYWEETDWCYQAAEKGYAMAVCPGAVCYDKIGTTIGRGFLADYYYTRNGLLFIDKYKGKVGPMVFVFVFFRFLKRIVRGDWGRAKGVYRGTLAFLKEENR